VPFIKKIEVNGFKTFGRKTTLLFDRGFTAITGPNGSGKTNIIDAVLFALGEMSARRLRATNFSNLIFHGGLNSNRKKKAKVVIQFDNSDGRLPLDTATVTLSREIDQEGRSVYRVNGRRVSRVYVLEMLSMAGIAPNGHNIILQGTLTRLAEISPQERRKIIEDAIGIAQYDQEKAEAQKKLEAANISIKTVMGQVGEVQKRIEALERERNDLLRYNFIMEEIKRLEAIRLSKKIIESRGEIDKVSKRISDLKRRLEDLRKRREELRTKRYRIESDIRRYGLEQSEEKRNEILNIEAKIGELRSKLGELNSKIENGKVILEDLRKARIDLEFKIKNVKSEIEDCEARIRQLTAELAPINEVISKKQSVYDALSSEINSIRSGLEEENKAIREAEVSLEQIRTEALKIQAAKTESRSRIKVYSERLKSLRQKRKDLTASLKRLEDAFRDLKGIQEEQKTRLEALKKSLNKREERKRYLETQIKEAGKVAEMAREAIVEFEARRELVEKFNTEERSLRYIEQIGSEGMISGVHGRLKDFIKFPRRYKRAVEAAASGWLNSLIVEDLETAVICTEALRRAKLGRIKIIPLSALSRNKRITPPRDAGVLAVISDLIKCEERYSPAVSFVFGDTLLVSDEDSALRLSRIGFRSVTLSGDLFEAGGGVEGGYYRSPFDFSSFVPSESTLKALNKAVSALKRLLEAREDHIQELEDEIAEAQREIARLSHSLGRLGSEVKRVERNIQNARLNLKNVESDLENINGLLSKERSLLKQYEEKWNDLLKRENEIQSRLSEMKRKINLSNLREISSKRDEISGEIAKLKQKRSQITAEISSLRSKIEILKRDLKDMIHQRNAATNRVITLEREIKNASKQRENIIAEIEALKEKRDALSRFLSSAREDIEKLNSQIDRVDADLRRVEDEYERVDSLLDEAQLNLQNLNMQMERYVDRLKDLGYEEPILEESFRLDEIDEILREMRSELNSIGAVNQLASRQYKEQVSRYKELSMRLNEMERERMAIERFIEEIERKKYKAFMEAFNKINDKLDKYFFKLTGGGKAALKLEDPTDPFSGGVDMVVQFVGKPPILVSGASSGERSVAAVSFLFALREFTPASFYLFDEIDAHLDAFHVERLGELLSEESERSQFIVVTLKPEMISKADKVYGVYGRDGISYVISTTFKEAIQR